uniref:Uncharacterized protein LOC104266115 n=1 Tax=Phallusia mammillata TaxID=59560 RepID=A0A6F9DJJ8_9ASCI|nr:uncharacterized protein LOC104266115 [Phallusia mammillata]
MLHCNECKRWVHDECEDVIDMDTYFDMGTDYSCPRCRDEAEDVPPQSEDLVQNDETIVFSSPSTSQLPGKSGPSGILLEDVSQKDAAKRSNISASMESDQSSTGMKGSSTDPMLFSAGNQLGDLKKRNISGDISLHHPRLGSQDRKSSSDSHIGNIFPDADTQDPLSGLFSGDAYQPIVSVPMLFEDSQGNVLTKELPEWPKRKARRLSSDSSPPTKPQPKPALSPTDSPPNSHGKGMGKPGTMFGKGKPFTARRRPGVRGARGKGYSRGKGRGSRRPRGGLSASAGTPALNIPSPTGPMTSPGQPSPSPSVSARRRSRSRWRSSVSGAESVLGAIVAADVGPESADEEYGDSMHNTVVLCSADDDFTLNQDMCVVCGSFGQGAEGRLVACSQCGQCYHPYCVNLKLTKVVLRKGWRCLDCTVCEECGAADNPSHLLLCDDCDISYHTYCLKPPLQHVPKGGWKCKWCVRCTHCGSTSPGTNCDWQENYTSCGLCASLAHCPFCRKSYRDEEIIMQCSHCERWLHASCECLFSESDIEKVLEKGYTCILCRPKGTTPPHLDLNPHSMDGDPSTGIYPGRTRSDAEAVKVSFGKVTRYNLVKLDFRLFVMRSHQCSW